MTDTEVRSSALAVLQDPTTLDYATDPVAAVLGACERAKVLLGLVVAHGDIDQVVELKARIDAVAVYTRHKHFGRAVDLAVQEIVRRAERGLGVTVRREQAAGRVLKQGENLSYRQVGPEILNEKYGKRSSGEFFTSNSEMAAAYSLADGISDEQFEAAVAEAKSDPKPNLSRANLRRKLRGDAPPKPKRQRPEQMRGMRRPDPNRIVAQTIQMSGIDSELAAEIEYSALDRNQLEEWVSSLASAINSLRVMQSKLKKELKKELSRE